MVALPFHVRVPDKEPLILKFKGYDTTLIFEKKRKFRPEEEETPNPPFKKVVPPGAETPIYYSEVAVFFTDVTFTAQGEYHFSDMGRPNKLKAFFENVITTDDQMKQYENEGDTTRVIKVAIRILNTFIGHYRAETQYFFTRYARYEEFPVVRVLAMAFKPMYGDMNNVKFMAQYVYSLVTPRYEFPDATADQCHRIISDIDNKEELSVVDELILSANNHFQEGNYRHALIDLETAFEAALQNRVEEHLMETGVKDEKIKRILNCRITSLISDHYPKCPNANPFSKGMDIYEKWRWACDRRNDLVHANRIVKEEESWTAFSYYNAVFKYLFDKPSWIELK